MRLVDIICGDSPIVLGLPHSGTWMPDDIYTELNENGRALIDTDWHVDQLYSDLLPGASRVRARFHRYVIDANRDPSGHSLYPGENTTDLVPLTDFDGRDIWRQRPDAAAAQQRLALYHADYHRALASELARVRALHGVAILFDCHSIRSQIPFLFDGQLPDFNIGTNEGKTCAPVLERCVAQVCAAAKDYSSVSNGRFKGGWTTRHYGQPSAGIHAIQMELAQSTYLQEEAPPWAFDDAKSDKLRPILAKILIELADLAPSLGETQ